MYNTSILEATEENILLAAGILRAGGLAAFPTETVYGLGADTLNPKAVLKIFEAKGRPQDNPLIVHVLSLEDALPLVTELPERAKQLAAAFWPGPLTMILPRSGRIDPAVSAGLSTVAIRVPSHPVARRLIEAAGTPVAAPSANRSGRPSPTSAQHCILDLSGRVDVILDGGSCQVGLESTVISLAGETPRILRPGGVTRERIEDIIGPAELDPAVLRHVGDTVPVASPGMKYRHYAPKARVTLVHGPLAAFAGYLTHHPGRGIWAMAFDGDVPELRRQGVSAVAYGGEGDCASQANRLFAVLRELDEQGAARVFVRAPKPEGVGLAVYNRLLRAASFEECYLEGDGCGCGRC